MPHVLSMNLAFRCLVALLVLAVGVGNAAAGGAPPPTPVPTVTPVKNTCLAGKTQCVRKHVQGFLKCDEKCWKNPKNCGENLDECWDKVRRTFERPDQPEKGCFEKLEGKEKQQKPETICVTTDDTESMDAKVDSAVDDLRNALVGEPTPLCGNGVVEGDESCDGLDLGGVDCAALGYETGTLGCTAGCGFDTTGCAVACESTGALVGGGCWFYGVRGESCDTVCGNVGGDYDDLTRTFAGSEGTDANCARVLAKLMAVGAPVPVDVNGSGDLSVIAGGVGCSTSSIQCPEPVDELGSSCWQRDNTTTTAAGTTSPHARACACQIP